MRKVVNEKEKLFFGDFKRNKKTVSLSLMCFRTKKGKQRSFPVASSWNKENCAASPYALFFFILRFLR